MLNINNLAVYYDGLSRVEEENIAAFHSNYNGEKAIHFSINAENASMLEDNIDIFLEDLKTFML